ncbi:hypothetical protein [Futiania mangrovi]|uniref:Uncharacterized protein n=1 Tax=Futiania mangrovi TaxID=2959716 RepID=A0A9J6PM43_9PROT|nr:hypothetical protein [Futiania mangrovii]MCP1337114.1 hypothetical protein [Futiania mangrovii]
MNGRDKTDAVAVLREMRSLAERLCAAPDPLLQGQAEVLRGRIDGLLSIAGDDIADLAGGAGFPGGGDERTS